MVSRRTDARLDFSVIDEDHQGVRVVDTGSQFSKRLREQPCLQAGDLLPHVALNLSLWHQRSKYGQNDNGPPGVSSGALKIRHFP